MKKTPYTLILQEIQSDTWRLPEISKLIIEEFLEIKKNFPLKPGEEYIIVDTSTDEGMKRYLCKKNLKN